MTTSESSPVAVSEATRVLPRRLFGDQVKKACRASDDAQRAPRVALYAERLMKGLDLWTGEPTDEAYEEAVRMSAVQNTAKKGGRRQHTNNTVGSA